jgi:hypothetical protein
MERENEKKKKIRMKPLDSTPPWCSIGEVRVGGSGGDLEGVVRAAPRRRTFSASKLHRTRKVESRQGSHG